MELIRKLNVEDFANFKAVFTVFESEPFFEAWTEEEYISEFLDFLNNGLMYGIFIGDTICGLITIKKKYLKWPELEIDVESSVYISDIAVQKNARNKGYATKLMKFIIDEFGSNYDIYMRTNLENSMSEGLALKHGFKVIENKIETVTFKRTRPDIPETDQRKYLIRNRAFKEQPEI